jgi:Domain of unknown function (DUF1996)
VKGLTKGKGRRVSAVAVLAALAGAFVLAGTAAPAAIHGVGQFAVPCKFDHRAPDDPIVFFGKPNTSHSHDFFGNKTTAASSTHQSLLAGGTSCRRPEDTSGYWSPTLRLNGRDVTPTRAQIYYQTAGRDPRAIRTFPAGLKMIAGDAAATGPQDPSIVSFGCGGGAQPLARTTPPLCPARDFVIHMKFPECWNGLELDSPDHRSHMAYASRVRGQGRVCPSHHPVSVPRIAFNVHYPVRGGPTVTLASGPHYTAHSDFFEAWQPGALQALVQRCLNAALICGST